MIKKLSPHQEKVLEAFDNQYNTDIDITTLYTKVYGVADGILFARDMQMKLAPTFRNINDKITHARIELGKTKRTYRLTVISE